MRHLLSLLFIILATPGICYTHSDGIQDSEGAAAPYQLAVYFDLAALEAHEPQIRGDVWPERHFFLRSITPDDQTPDSAENKPTTLYLVSGVLHAKGDGRFSLDFAMMDWRSPGSNRALQMPAFELELGKPLSIGTCGGLCRMYTTVISSTATKVVE